MKNKRKVLLAVLVLIVLVSAFYFITKAITKYTGYSVTGKVIDFLKNLSG